jgi:site-specific DNA-methyltransferase (cytosine-N4-specific)
LQISNTESNSKYTEGCKVVSVKQHPARFPAKLPEFFIHFLTDPGDLVIDIFAGSNTTGKVAEVENRLWLAFEEKPEYLAASTFRFLTKENTVDEIQEIYNLIMQGESVNLKNYQKQTVLNLF